VQFFQNLQLVHFDQKLQRGSTRVARGDLKRSAAVRPSVDTLVQPLWRAAGSGAKAPLLAARSIQEDAWQLQRAAPHHHVSHQKSMAVLWGISWPHHTMCVLIRNQHAEKHPNVQERETSVSIFFYLYLGP